MKKILVATSLFLLIAGRVSAQGENPTATGTEESPINYRQASNLLKEYVEFPQEALDAKITGKFIVRLGVSKIGKRFTPKLTGCPVLRGAAWINFSNG